MEGFGAGHEPFAIEADARQAGHLAVCVPAAWGGARSALDTRALCLAREVLA